MSVPSHIETSATLTSKSKICLAVSMLSILYWTEGMPKKRQRSAATVKNRFR
jgi:hypothetical protein